MKRDSTQSDGNMLFYFSMHEQNDVFFNEQRSLPTMDDIRLYCVRILEIHLAYQQLNCSGLYRTVEQRGIFVRKMQKLIQDFQYLTVILNTGEFSRDRVQQRRIHCIEQRIKEMEAIFQKRES